MALDANALVTLADQKTYLNISDSNSDSILEILINSVSTLINVYCERTLIETTYTDLYLDGNGEKEIQLPNWPVASITSLAEDETSLTEGLDEDYLLYTSDRAAYLWRYGDGWVDMHKGILITYVAGYSTVPKDLQLACFKQVAFEFHKWKNKDWGESSRSMADGSISVTTKNLLEDVEETLQRYKAL